MAGLNVTGSLPSSQEVMAELKQQALERMKNAARTAMGEFMALTPVWSGKTVRNYAWGIGEAPSGGMKEPIGGDGYVPGAGWAAQRKGDPGPTNSMALGDEPRRAANEEAALADMEDVLSGYTELRPLVLTNFSDVWDLVDNGSAPTPERSRSPGGVSILAEQATKANLGDDFQ
jgi:hypothetical protein